MPNKPLTASPDKKLTMLKLNNKEEKAILKTAKVLKKKYPIEEVILFGS